MNQEERQRRIAQFEKAHRESGLPVTMQRRAVFEAILEREDHPTADQVYEAVHARSPQISRMTVYRILGNLIWLGLVAKTCHPGSTARFDPKIRQHHHLVCLDCDRIIDLEEERLNKVAWPDVRRLGFEIEDYHIDFRGRCAACQQKRKKTGSNRKAASRIRIPRKKSPTPS
jgi:Fur family transcriptional regulator, peroxide stress response regulator